MNNTYDLVIVGGGPAGVAAGVYASRKRLKTLFITENFEGQSAVSEGIENWIGTVKISGADLAKALEAHLRAYAGNVVEIKTGARVTSILKNKTGNDDATEVANDNSAERGIAEGGAPNTNSKTSDPSFTITTTDFSGKEEMAEAKAVLITTGSSRRKLQAVGADIFEHKGLTYCATCDGPIFEGQDVAVIGGGNAAFESVAQLSAYCKSVTIINRSGSFRADEVTVEKVLAKPNVKVIYNAKVIEVKGEKFVTAITYQTDGMMSKESAVSENKNGESEIKDLAVTGIFVEIGLLPNTGFVKDIVELDPYGKIIVDSKTQITKTDGIWAAGDCTDGLYHQNNIAAGDAIKALEDIYIHLSKR